MEIWKMTDASPTPSETNGCSVKHRWSSILQCSGSRNQQPYPAHGVDLQTFTVYAVKEIGKSSIFQVNWDGNDVPVSLKV